MPESKHPAGRPDSETLPSNVFDFNHSSGRADSFTLPIQRLPPLNANISEESLHLPIQQPSPIKRKPVPGRPDSATLPADAFKIADTGRRDSDTLPFSDPYHDPATRLKDSRVKLLRNTLVPQLFNPNPITRDATQDQVNGISMRCEPDRSIRSPVSPEGRQQSAIYQKPAYIPWTQQAVQDPHGRLKDVRAEIKLKCAGAVPRGTSQPRQRLQERMRQKARKEYVVLAGIRRERDQLQRTQQWLNGRNEEGGYAEPLLTSREREDAIADIFEREHEARRNGERRRLPPRKLTKPVPPSSTGVERATRYEREGVVQEDFSGWYWGNRKRDRVWKKVKVVLAKMLRPKANRWQRI